ncbi:hypothetical protein [Chryseobacterium vrystaatense]|nr:hypothetical protein [Chryseobacterium vrystaatense]
MIDPEGGTGPYFQLMLSNYGQNLSWDASQEQPNASAFTLTLAYNSLVTNRRITYSVDVIEPVAPWLTISGASVVGSEIATSGTGVKNISVNIGNVSAMPNGIYNTQVSFFAYGKYQGLENLYDFVSYIVTLTINNSGASIKVELNQYNVFFNRQTGTLSGETSVKVLNNTTPVELKFEAQYFQSKSGVTNKFDLVGLNMANDPNLPSHGSVIVNGGLFKSGNTRVTDVNINLIIGQNADIFLDKSAINLSIIKSNTQPATTNFYLTNPENKSFTISSPSWLNTSIVSGSASTYVTVSTIPPSMLSSGIYTGKIKVDYDNKQIVIEVVLSVVSFINFPISGNNFCMDIPKITFNKMNLSSRFVKITIKAVFNQLGVEMVKENQYIIPYVNDKADFAIGEKVQKQFPRFKGDFFSVNNEIELMKNAVVSFKAEELDSSYNILLTELHPEIKLLPGSKPEGYPLLTNFMFRKRNPNAVFFNSKVFDGNIIVEKIEDTNDIDSIQYGDKKVVYYEYPKYNKILHLHFENDNLSPEWFSFTGEFKISSDYSHIYAKSVFNIQNEKYDFSKVKMLTVNSGFFMKEELGLIEKIIESRLCYIKINDKVYRCFSTLQKHILRDSLEELANKELEFLIVE